MPRIHGVMEGMRHEHLSIVALSKCHRCFESGAARPKMCTCSTMNSFNQQRGQPNAHSSHASIPQARIRQQVQCLMGKCTFTRLCWFHMETQARTHLFPRLKAKGEVILAQVVEWKVHSEGILRTSTQHIQRVSVHCVRSHRGALRLWC